MFPLSSTYIVIEINASFYRNKVGISWAKAGFFQCPILLWLMGFRQNQLDS